MGKILLAISIAVLCSFSGRAGAANYSDPIDGVFKGIYGDAITVEVPSLESKSPVANENENGDLSFHFNPNTAYRNFNQLTDLKYGDPVRVEYIENPTNKDKQMIATVITKVDSEVVENPVDTVDNNVVPAVPVTQSITTTTTTTKVDTQ